MRSLFLSLQRKTGNIVDIVEQSGRYCSEAGNALLIQLGMHTERAGHELRQIERTEIACAMRRQRDFSARIGGADHLLVIKIVIALNAINEEHAGIAAIERRSLDFRP